VAGLSSVTGRKFITGRLGREKGEEREEREETGVNGVNCGGPPDQLD